MTSLKDIASVAKKIGSIDKNAEELAKLLASDFSKRGQAWIVKPVVKKYNIKAKEVKGTIKKTKPEKQEFGGVAVDAVAFEITSDRLYPSANRFGMTPKQPKETNTTRKSKATKRPYQVRTGNYKLYATILKGKKQMIGEYINRKPSGKGKPGTSGVILMKVGGHALPFQRKGEHIYKFNTVTTGQMVNNEKVSDEITKLVHENMSKRLEHHKNRLMK